jgi:hypothetical protein
MAESEYKRLNLGSGYQQNTDTDVLGGTTVAVDVDLKSKPGTVRARKSDAVDVLSPLPPHSFVYDVVVKRNFGSDDKTYGVLTKGYPTEAAAINGFATRGFKDLSGNSIPGDPNQNGWKFHQGTRMSVTTGNLEHNNREIRFHSADPIWYGTIRGMAENTVDYRYTEYAPESWVSPAGQTFQLLNTLEVTEQSDEIFNITGPFSESNKILPPQVGSLQVLRGLRMGQDYNPGTRPMFGDCSDVGFDGNPRYQFLYFAASYLYDGFQESPLTLLNVIEIRGQGDDWVSGNRDTWESICIDLLIKGVGYGVSGVQGAYRNIPKRVRKIRLYCFPSPTRISDPKSSGRFYLVNEIDVSKWDSENKGLRLSLPCVSRTRADGGFGYKGVEVDVTRGWTSEAEESPFDVEWPEFIQGNPYFKLGDDDTEFPISKVYVRLVDGEVVNRRHIMFLTDLSHYVLLDNLMGRLGQNAFVRVYHSFRNTDNSPIHRTYIGDELLKRPTYDQLSGLLNTAEYISPARERGYGGYDVPIIYRVRDKDGQWHKNRMMWATHSPAGVITSDRFLEYRDSEFNLVSAARSGVYLAMLGDAGIEFGTITQDEIGWDFSDVFAGIGCVAERSVAETPHGVMFLSQDGVRMLIGNTISDVISLPVREFTDDARSYQSSAVGNYSARWNWYILHFPEGETNLSGVLPFYALVYDFDVKEWALLYLDVETAYCGTTDPNGDALFAGVFGNCLSKISASDDYKPYPHYTVYEIFDDPVHEKTLQNLKLNFEKSSVEDISLIITTDTTSSKPADENGLSQVLGPETLTSGVGTTRRAMSARLFKFAFSGFSELNNSFVRIERGERD